MQITQLAEGFAKIEATTKHRLMAEVLADLFRRAREDTRILPYLMEGRLGPPYSALDLGMDERRLAEALGQGHRYLRRGGVEEIQAAGRPGAGG